MKREFLKNFKVGEQELPKEVDVVGGAVYTEYEKRFFNHRLPYTEQSDVARIDENYYLVASGTYSGDSTLFVNEVNQKTGNLENVTSASIGTNMILLLGRFVRRERAEKSRPLRATEIDKTQRVML